MNRLLTPLLTALILGSGAAMAAGPAQSPGHQLMTEQEQAEMRIRMQNATTEQERTRIRAEQHVLIRERAAKQGIVLPETPPAQGQGMGAGRNGPGKGSGGMGPGGPKR